MKPIAIERIRLVKNRAAVSKEALAENRYGTISDTLFLLRHPPLDEHPRG